MLYERSGVSAAVRGAIARAVAIAHAVGVRVIYHSTCSFAAPSLDGFSERELAMLAIDGATGRYAFIPNWNGWYLWCMNNPDFRDEYYSKEAAQGGVAEYIRRCGIQDIYVVLSESEGVGTLFINQLMPENLK